MRISKCFIWDFDADSFMKFDIGHSQIYMSLLRPSWFCIDAMPVWTGKKFQLLLKSIFFQFKINAQMHGQPKRIIKKNSADKQGVSLTSFYVHLLCWFILFLSAFLFSFLLVFIGFYWFLFFAIVYIYLFSNLLISNRPLFEHGLLLDFSFSLSLK